MRRCLHNFWPLFSSRQDNMYMLQWLLFLLLILWIFQMFNWLLDCIIHRQWRWKITLDWDSCNLLSHIYMWPLWFPAESKGSTWPGGSVTALCALWPFKVNLFIQGIDSRKPMLRVNDHALGSTTFRPPWLILSRGHHFVLITPRSSSMFICVFLWSWKIWHTQRRSHRGV